MKPWILVLSLAVIGLAAYLMIASTRAGSRSTPRPGASAASRPADAARPGSAGGSPSPATSRPEPPRLAGPEDEPAGPAVTQPAAPSGGTGPAQTGEEMRDTIEESFAADHPDAASRDLAQGLERGVRAVLPPGSSVSRLECRSSLCRVETVHANIDEFRTFADRAYMTVDPTRVSNGPVFAGLVHAPVEGEPLVAVAYLGREGSVLPLPAAVTAPEEP
ncbi:MAG TPA: hypothetical protein VK698_21540 [Kofleriaceae bacterium]|nr:hypothetical protein [Kofleriaceae bacterium]